MGTTGKLSRKELESRILRFSFLGSCVLSGAEVLMAVILHSYSILMDAVFDSAELIMMGPFLVLIPLLHINGLYISNILNGFICLGIILWYVRKRTGKFPKSIEDILMIPDDFGAGDNDRIDIEVKEIGAVNTVSEQVIAFCRGHGIDQRRSNFAGLALEEMAGNVVEHGFTKDKKKHVVDMRVVHKNGDIILRILDNCRSFDPLERIRNFNEGDRFSNVGIRLVNSISKDVQYQNLLGMNVLTIRI